MESLVIEKLQKFFSQFPIHEYKKGEIIIQATSIPSGIYFIESGIIRRYYLSENGEEVTLNLYKPNAFLPMSWAISNVPNSHFYEAMIPTITRKTSKQDVLTFLKKEPDITYDLLKRVYIGMEGLWMHLESLTAGTSYTKLIASIVILAKRFGKKNGDNLIVYLKMSERDLANYAGMSRETASRELQKLKINNLLSFQKGILKVHDIQKIEDLLLH